MNGIVYRGKDNQPLTNSLLVAETFGKEHRNVLRDIKNLIEGGVLKNEQTPMFEETTYMSEQNKQSYPLYVMNQDGFTLLAMGFNGKKAMEFKLKYIEAFNAMKKQIEQSKPSVPKNYLEALKSLVKAEEEKQQLALENKQKDETIITISKANVELGNKITEMLPKVELLRQNPAEQRNYDHHPDSARLRYECYRNEQGVGIYENPAQGERSVDIVRSVPERWLCS